jgi:hypothetical protein
MYNRNLKELVQSLPDDAVDAVFARLAKAVGLTNDSPRTRLDEAPQNKDLQDMSINATFCLSYSVM